MYFNDEIIYNDNMLFRLFLLFALIPVVELSLLIEIGSRIGTFNTIIIVIVTAIVGAYMVRLEGLHIIYRMRNNLQEGIFPAEELIDGIMILIAGALLLTPGFFTDVVGILMVVPISRNWIKRIFRWYLEKHVSSLHRM